MKAKHKRWLMTRIDDRGNERHPDCRRLTIIAEAITWLEAHWPVQRVGERRKITALSDRDIQKLTGRTEGGVRAAMAKAIDLGVLRSEPRLAGHPAHDGEPAASWYTLGDNWQRKARASAIPTAEPRVHGPAEPRITVVVPERDHRQADLWA